MPTEEVASQQQTLAVAEGPLQDMTVTCKQCEVTLVFTKGEKRFFQGGKMTQPARCPECRKRIREKRAETASENGFQDSPSGPKFKTVIITWAMCEGWWTEARNADERSGMQARGMKQRKLVEDTSRELLWIESGSLVRDFGQQWNTHGIPEFLGRLKARGHALMAKWVKISCWGKMENKVISGHYQVGCSGSGNCRWNCVRDGSRKRVQQVM